MRSLADQDAHADHGHFDNDVNFEFIKSETDGELIIQRVGK